MLWIDKSGESDYPIGTGTNEEDSFVEELWDRRQRGRELFGLAHVRQICVLVINRRNKAVGLATNFGLAPSRCTRCVQRKTAGPSQIRLVCSSRMAGCWCHRCH
jgi:hypothetical protein